MGIAKVTRNYQVTIPKDIRRIKDINIGDTVFFCVEGEKVDFFKMKRENVIKETAGIWGGKENGVDYVRRIRKSWSKREKRV